MVRGAGSNVREFTFQGAKLGVKFAVATGPGDAGGDADQFAGNGVVAIDVGGVVGIGGDELGAGLEDQVAAVGRGLGTAAVGQPADEDDLPVRVGGIGAPDVKVAVARERFFAEGVFVVGEDALGGEVGGGAVGDAEDISDFGAGSRTGDLVQRGAGVAFPIGAGVPGGMSQT